MCYIKVFLLWINILHWVFCFEPCSTDNKIVTDLKSNLDCGEGFFYLPNGNPVHKCFPRCFPKYDLKTTPCSDVTPCPQGYVCPENLNPNERFCLVDKESCFKYYTENESDNKWEHALWKPECLPSGEWAPKQCKGEQTNGRCFCFDAKGNRIFGEARIQDADDMTCACSRKANEEINSQLDIYRKFHCDSKGNYEALQCDKEHCLCVDPKTGSVTSKIVSKSMMSLLPCYSERNIGEIYLRQCESDKYAHEELLRELKMHGTDHTSFSPIVCDTDGTYGIYKIEKAVVSCRWKDNSQIENFQTSVDENPSLVNCNCARDMKIYEQRNQKQALICSGNGNYQPQQHINATKWYCVDQDGFRKSEFFDKKPNNCDEYY